MVNLSRVYKARAIKYMEDSNRKRKRSKRLVTSHPLLKQRKLTGQLQMCWQRCLAPELLITTLLSTGSRSLSLFYQPIPCDGIKCITQDAQISSVEDVQIFKY